MYLHVHAAEEADRSNAWRRAHAHHSVEGSCAAEIVREIGDESRRVSVNVEVVIFPRLTAGDQRQNADGGNVGVGIWKEIQVDRATACHTLLRQLAVVVALLGENRLKGTL